MYLSIVAQVPSEKTGRDTSARIFSYNHRTWGHLCWEFSAINGKSKFYYDGMLLMEEILSLNGINYAFQDADSVDDAAFIFGQEPDSMRGNFDRTEAFLGELSELNVWNYILEDAEIQKLATCNIGAKGNIISWSKEKMAISDVQISDSITLATLCLKNSPYVIFPQKLRYLEAKEICEIHGGHIALPKSEAENRKILELVIKHKNTCLSNDTSHEEKVVWIGAKKADGQWYKTDSNKNTIMPLDYTNLLSATSTPNYDCSYLQLDGFWFGGTYACNQVSLCTVCSIQSYPVFTLKGSCDVGPIDWNYYLKLNEGNQIEMYEGYKRTNIVYDNITTKWRIQMKSGSKEGFRYTLKYHLSAQRYPIGRHKWEINDYICNVQSKNSLIALTRCNIPSQFTCDSGHCIDINKRCDQQKDCEDNSDEKKCALVNIPTSYNKASVPESNMIKYPMQIGVHEDLVSIDSIDTVHMQIILTIEFHLSWNDKRLTFSNPSKTGKNHIPHLIKERLWTPMLNIIHENAVIGEITYDSMDDIKLIANVAEPPVINKAIENRVFNGTFNKLELTQRGKIKYNCLFNVKNFPFDGQNCTAIMKLAQTKAEVIVFFGDGNVTYKGPENVDQFLIEISKMETKVENTELSTRYIITIPMSRIYTHQLLITFVPTFILWLFGYSTLFIDIQYSNDRFMGAGTALLVMVTLLNAVTNELPETSYTKLIDYWFLWHLLLIFCTIVFHVVLGRIQNNMEAPTNSNIITPLPYKHMDAIKLMEINSMSKTTKINNAAIMIFPILNGIFYAIYFYCTLSEK